MQIEIPKSLDIPKKEIKVKKEMVEETIVADLSVTISEEKIIVEETITDIVEEPRPKPRRELPKQSALGAMMRDVHQEVEVKDEKKVELTGENLQQLWKDFLVEYKGKLQNAFVSVAEKQTPQLEEEKIVFIETNNISLELLKLHKLDITSYFRKKTTSNMVTPEFRLLRNETAQKEYKTQKDRIKEMIANNPSVLKLIEKLDLNEY